MELNELLIYSIIYSIIITVISFLLIKFFQGHTFKYRPWNDGKKYWDWILNHQWFFFILASLYFLVFFITHY